MRANFTLAPLQTQKANLVVEMQQSRPRRQWRRRWRRNDDDDVQRHGGEDEGELRGGEEIGGSIRRFQEVDDGDDNGEIDVRGD
ncbi:hypothetical protein L2E82_32767 [Cichorium intybus]|uniref:Uncharacterized protein n=1 Tax=Cichorium intybus TaxID=13427 RepID=A0ACB9BIC4_CICIN|nr:hypothetical protein L2E82_32767 [Cichorium intybus]